MDLKGAQAVVLPSKAKSFDPTRIPKAIKDAGFTPGEIEVTAAGTLVRNGKFLALRVTNPALEFVLAGGPKADELQARKELLEQRVRIKGRLHPSHGDQPPGLTVREWTPLPAK